MGLMELCPAMLPVHCLYQINVTKSVADNGGSPRGS